MPMLQKTCMRAQVVQASLNCTYGQVGELCECFQWRPDADTTVGLPSWSENGAMRNVLHDLLLVVSFVCARV